MSNLNSKSQPNPTRRLSLPKKLLFAFVITAGFFLFVEAALAAFGFGVATDTSDPFVGFSQQIPLLEEFTNDDGIAEVRTAQNKLVWFNDQQFPIKKPADTKRIFCVGGSTTYGRPYADSTSFSGWLRELLPISENSQAWEVINAGGVSYASYRVAAVMEELSNYEPDIFIVYTGQNEFLERRTYATMFDQSDFKIRITSALSRTRTWTLLRQAISPGPNQIDNIQADKNTSVEQLPGEVDEMLNHTIGPADYHRNDDWHDKVRFHYKVNLQRMISIAHRCGAEIVFVVPASNEKDCSPFKSESKPDISDTDRSQFNQLSDDASEATEAGDETLAIKLLSKTKTIDNEVSDVDYRLGRLFFANGETEKAAHAFSRSLDHDVCPLRIPAAFAATLRSVAKDNGVSMVDFPKRLRDLCFAEHGHRILGEEYFLDHVHPNIDTQRQLAIWIMQQLRSDSLIKGVELTKSQIDAATKRVMNRIDPFAQAVAMRNLAKVLHWAGKFDEALPRARDALSMLTNDPESLLVQADCLRQTGRVNAATESYELLTETSPLYMRAYMPYGELLMDKHQYAKARDNLTMAVIGLTPNSPQQIRSQYLLGMTHVILDEYEQAVPLLEQLSDYYAEDPDRLFFLAKAKAGLGDEDAAIKLYKQLLEIAPNDAEAKKDLGVLVDKKTTTQQ